MERLESEYQVYAVDLRGQGRSSRTPGRYTFDNMGNDLARFITFVIKRPVVVCGLSSGGVLSAWLSAYAPPGTIRGAYYEDPPLFSCELVPTVGPSIRQTVPGMMFDLTNSFLGDQWSVGNWEGLIEKCKGFLAPEAIQASFGTESEPIQRIKEYDPEWGKACFTGTISASCNHAQMLSSVKCPVLHTMHMSFVDKQTGKFMGSLSEEQKNMVVTLIKESGESYTAINFPEMVHSMHGQDPDLYVKTLKEWINTLPEEK